MRELGLFGALVPAEHGGLGLRMADYARVIEELCRGWMSLAGVINSHTMAALIVLHHGTDEQRRRLPPRFAIGVARGGLCLTEPHAGSDVQAIRTVARRQGDHYLISGTKMFVTNGREGNTFALLARTDTAADPPHRGMSCFIVEKGAPGLEVAKSIAKLGYKGVDTAELVFDDFPVPAANLVGGVEGRGLQARHGRAGDGPHQYRRARGRGGTGGARGGHQRRAAGHRRSRPWPRWPASPPAWKPPRLAHRLGGGNEGPRRALRPRGGYGQALRLRGRAGGGGETMRIAGRRSAARGVAGGAPLPRHAAHDHR